MGIVTHEVVWHNASARPESRSSAVTKPIASDTNLFLWQLIFSIISSFALEREKIEIAFKSSSTSCWLCWFVVCFNDAMSSKGKIRSIIYDERWWTLKRFIDKFHRANWKSKHSNVYQIDFELVLFSGFILPFLTFAIKASRIVTTHFRLLLSLAFAFYVFSPFTRYSFMIFWKLRCAFEFLLSWPVLLAQMWSV